MAEDINTEKLTHPLVAQTPDTIYNVLQLPSQSKIRSFVKKVLSTGSVATNQTRPTNH